MAGIPFRIVHTLTPRIDAFHFLCPSVSLFRMNIFEILFLNMTLYQHDVTPTQYRLPAILIDFTFTLKESENQSTHTHKQAYRMQFFFSRFFQIPSTDVFNYTYMHTRGSILISIIKHCGISHIVRFLPSN